MDIVAVDRPRSCARADVPRVTGALDLRCKVQQICCNIIDECAMAASTLRDVVTVLRAAEATAGAAALGSQLALAEWAGVHRSQITRLRRGQEVGGDPGWRLAGLFSVILALLEVYEPEAISDWLQGINPHLNDRRPLDVLAHGELAEVMAAVQAARIGSYA